MGGPSPEHRKGIVVPGGRGVALGALLIAMYVLVLDLANVDLGRADNGDFTRLVGHWVSKPVGFAVSWPSPESVEWRQRFFHCFHPVWESQPEVGTRPPVAWDAGSANLVWTPIFLLQRALRDDGLFDMRVLGRVLRGLRLAAVLALYGALALLLRGRSAWWSLAVAAPCVLTLSDPRAATFFNSFYREGMTLVYAPALIAALLAFAVVPRRWSIAVFTIAVTLVAGSATAHVPIALLGAAALPAAALWASPGAESDRSVGDRLAVVLGMVMMLALAIALPTATPAHVRSNVAFQALFFGALRVSDDPARDVAELGLPVEALQLVGKTAFDAESQPFRDAHGALVRHRLVAELLWRRPALAWRLLSRTADELWGGTGSFLFVADASCASGLPRLAWWTALKRACAPRGGVVLVLLGLAAVGGIWRARRPGSIESVAGLTLAFAALAALAEIAATGLGDGLSDLGRHLAPASFFADATLGLALLQLAFVRRP